MIDALLGALFLSCGLSLLWFAVLGPFFLKGPMQRISLLPMVGVFGGFFLGLLGAIIAGGSDGPSREILDRGTLLGSLAGLGMMVASLLGMAIRALIIQKQFTIRTGMITIAVVGVLCGLIRLFIT